MCEQLGDPSVFATNSHADTFCPYLADFIVAYAHLEDSPLDPRAEGLTEGQRHQRRLELVKLYPALVAQFFHLKTELYLEHVCKEGHPQREGVLAEVRVAVTRHHARALLSLAGGRARLGLSGRLGATGGSSLVRC